MKSLSLWIPKECEKEKSPSNVTFEQRGDGCPSSPRQPWGVPGAVRGAGRRVSISGLSCQNTSGLCRRCAPAENIPELGCEMCFTPTRKLPEPCDKHRQAVNLPDFESQRLSAHPILYFIDPPASLRNEGSKSGSPFDGRVWPGAREDVRGDPNGIRNLWSLLTV